MYIHFIIGFFISMVPMIELKGSIIYMILASKEALGDLSYFVSFLVGFLGSSAIAPVLLLIFIPLIEWAKGTRLLKGVATWLENHFKKKSDSLEQKSNDKASGEKEELRKKRIERAKYFGLFVFTAIPLPLTGCWTASIVASILKLDYKKSLLFIILGNIVAGIAITLLGGVLNLAFFGGAA